MKDYRLSEMLEICHQYDDCLGCPFEKICENGISSINAEDIEQRDLIELPTRKTIQFSSKLDVYKYLVIYKSNKDDDTICIKKYKEQKDADDFFKSINNEKEKK